MSKFERIVREPLVMGGQARIRDTGITVNEIVRLSLDGASQAEILQKFPMLEAEDVHEALGWQAQDITSLLRESLHDNRSSLASIQGFSDVLLMLLKTNGVLSYELSHDKILAIQASATRMHYIKNTLLDGLDVLAKLGQPLEAKQIDWVILKPHIENDVVGLPSVMARTSPTEILSHLAVGKLNNHEVPDLAKILVNRVNKELFFTVSRQGSLEKFLLEYPSEIAMANLLIYDSGSDLKIRQEENIVIFEFVLPIVDAPG
jgi:uncharacterized protein (DUF433 family)